MIHTTVLDSVDERNVIFSWYCSCGENCEEAATYRKSSKEALAHRNVHKEHFIAKEPKPEYKYFDPSDDYIVG